MKYSTPNPQRNSYLMIFLLCFSSLVYTSLNAQTITVTNPPNGWLIPAGVTSINVTCYGGGGAGGGASATDRNGGGGGGGASAKLTGYAVTPGTALTIVIGAGGTGVSSNTGGAGGFSSVAIGATTICKAVGGAGGAKAASATTAGAGGAGGAIASNIPANSGFKGGNGGGSNPTTTSTDQSGGGGGGGGSTGAGGNGGFVTAGAAGAGGGGAGGVGISTTSNGGGAGTAGNAFGGGGGGATVYNTGTRAGANGAAGGVVITFTCVSSVAPTGISGTTSVCPPASTTLTSSGGSLGTDAIDVWYAGGCGTEAFAQNWITQPYTPATTTVNTSTTYGVQNLTSTSADPNLNMTGLGSFNPNTYRYVNVRFRVTSVTQIGAIELFWYNTLYTTANGLQYKNQPITSVQNVWQTVSIDMLSPTAGNWLHSNVTGWRFDWTTNSGVTMDIDFVTLTDRPIVNTGPSITVAPTSSTTYYTAKRAACSAVTACTSQLINTSCASPAITSIPGSACVGSTISVTGTNLSGVSAATINGVAATFSNNTTTNVDLVVPAGAAGLTSTISLTTGAGSATSSTNITVNPLATAGTFQYTNGSTQSICSGSTISCSNTVAPTNGGAGTLSVVWYCGEEISPGVYGNWKESTLGNVSGTTSSTNLNTAAGGGTGMATSLSNYNPLSDFPSNTKFLVIRRGYTSTCGVCVGGCQDQSFYLNLLSPTVSVGGAVTAVCSGQTTAALGGSFGGSSTAAVWSDGGAGGSFTNNSGSTPGTATYTASTVFASPVTLTLTTSGGSCGTTNASKSLTINSPAPLPTPVTASPAAICLGSSTNLNATFAGNSINWYTTATGGSPFSTVASGTNVSVSPSTTTTYYAESVYGSTVNQTFTASGSFTVPAGVTSITAYAWGGGGGGGGAWANTTSYGAAGGGGGGSMKSATLTVAPTQVYTVTIGAGGTAGNSSGSNGGAGGTTTFTGTGGTVSTLGGSGGTGCTTSGGTAGGAGGTGGTFNGGNGSNGNNGSSYTNGGGGGGGAGSGAVGGNAPAASDALGGPGGTGGGGTYSGGNGGSHPKNISSGNAGVAGVAPGGGGSGASDYDAWGYAGGAGARGQVIVVSNPTGCPSSTRVPVVVTVDQPATVSNAGTVPTPTCSNVAATLNANNPTVGTGQWSVTSGPSTSSAQFSNVLSRTSTFTAAGGAGSYVLAWTITNGACSSNSTATANVVAIPNQPTVVTGNAAPCNPSAQTYAVTNDANVVTYNWTFPSGWSTLSGGNTNSIKTYLQGSGGGTISVTGTNTCGTSTARTFTVTPDNNPPVISGYSNINLNNIAGTCGATATWSAPTATDACTTFGPNTTTFSTAGATGFVVPAGVTSITVQVWGAGGGGGGATGFGSATGGGGGGGGFAERTISVTPGTFYPITVGAGGAGGVAASGAAGGTSSFSTLVVATGGAGGVRGSSIISPTNGTGGAAGNGTAGTILRLGGAGATGVAGSGGGGGGGSAGTAAVGNAASGITGGAAVSGGGAGANAVAAISTVGGTGGAPGGGGSGSRRGSSILNPDANGGPGGNGQVKVSWTQPGPVQTAGPVSGSTFAVGTTPITYTATDAAGFSSTCTFNVIVADAEAPTIATNADVYTCSTTPSLSAPVASDNCSGIGAITNNAPSTFPIGTTLVSWSVTDAGGNTSTSTQNVTVYPRPTSSWTGITTLCPSATDSLFIHFTGTAPYSFTYTIGATSYDVSGYNGTVFGFPISLLTTTNFEVTALSDANCAAQVGDLGGVKTVTVASSCASTWLGGTSTDWGTASNWSPSFVPNACAIDVTIPSGTPNPPTISGNNYSVGSVTIASGVNLTLTGNNLSVCGNWNAGTGADAVTIGTGNIVFQGGSAHTISGNTTFNKITLNDAAGASLNAGSTVDITDRLNLQAGTLTTSAGVLTFKSSSATQCATIDHFTSGYTGSISGNIYAERFVPVSGSNQHFISSPIDNVSLSQFGASGTAGYVIPTSTCDETLLQSGSPYGSVFQYHEDQAATCALKGWEVKTSGSADNARGYSVYLTGLTQLSLNGTPQLSSTVTLNGLTNTGWANHTTLQGRIQSSGWNLVGNPYLANLDLSTHSGFDNQVQVWVTSGPYAGTYQASIMGTNATVAPFQAFMVHKSSIGNTSFTIAKTECSNTPQQFFKTNDSELEIVLSGNGFNDKTNIQFNANATTAFDPSFDANKIHSKLGQPTLYTLESSNAHLAINTYPSLTQTVSIPLSLEPGKNGQYSLSFNKINSFDPTQVIYLEDKKLGGAWINLRGNPNYNFQALVTDHWDRFVLHFMPALNVRTVDAVCDQNGKIELSQSGITNWTFVLDNANGTSVSNGNVDASNPAFITLPSGIYTLSLTDNSGYSTIKTIQVNSTVIPVNADFTLPATADAGVAVQLTDVSSNASSGLLYTWDFGDGTTASGIMSPLHTYTNPGTYSVMLTVSTPEGCNAISNKSITVSSKNTTSIETITEGSGLNIYAVKDKVFVSFEKNNDKEANIKIYSIIGQELSNEMFSGTGTYTKSLNLEVAFVVVTVKQKNAKMVTKKVFITNQ